MAANSPQPTAHEQYLLELINRARANPEAEVQRNDQISSLTQGLSANSISPDPKQPLAFDGQLLAAARDHSQWMLDTDTFSHIGAENSSPRQRMVAAGYDFTGRSTSGENISWRGTTGTPNLTAYIPQQHSGLFASPGHRRNLMNGAFKQVGLGVIVGEYSGYNASMITQKFAASGNTSYLTGVLYDDAVRDDDFYTVGEGLADVRIEAVRQDGARTTAYTYDSGGYSLALTPGSYTISFSGGELGRTVSRTVTIESRNVKLDIASDQLPAREAAPAPAVPTVPEPPAAAAVPQPIAAPIEPRESNSGESPPVSADDRNTPPSALGLATPTNSLPDTLRFDPVQYLAAHQDLIKAFGFNPAAAVQHYAQYGRTEGRGTLFNAAGYLASYGDLIEAFGFNPTAAAEHYVRHGYGEGRSPSFDGVQYLASYGDLINAFSFNPAAAAEHYVRHGYGEGRLTDTFDELSYLASYGDLVEAFGFDLAAASEHYVRHGAGEGRGTDGFDAASYLANYADLQAAFGQNLQRATEHFIRHGYGEGRTDAA